MNYIFLLMLVSFSGLAHAEIGESSSYLINSTHLGLSGDEISTLSYTGGRMTLTHEQGGDMMAESSSYFLNLGWYETNWVRSFFDGLIN